MEHQYPGSTVDHKTLESIQGIHVSIPHPTQLTHLQFRRFAGCPMCNLHIRSFIQRHSDLIAHEIQEVAVFHSSKKAMLKHHSDAPFALIADPMKMLYREFGVESSLMSLINPKAWPAAMTGLLRHGAGLPGFGESVIGLPADFLIDSAGRVIASKYGSHAYDQWSVDELLSLAKNRL
jgi:hypothetical protein